MPKQRRLVVAVVALILGAAIVIGGISLLTNRLPPADREMLQRLERVQNEMTEEEVDEIFEGYKPTRVDEEQTYSINSKPLIRVSNYSKEYLGHDDIGGYTGVVYFDYFGRVVGKGKKALLCN